MANAKTALVWIQLPAPADREAGDLYAELANNMLARLNGGAAPDRTLSWNPDRGLFDYGNDMGHTTLVDGGFWVSLAHVGRPL